MIELSRMLLRLVEIRVLKRKNLRSLHLLNVSKIHLFGMELREVKFTFIVWLELRLFLYSRIWGKEKELEVISTLFFIDFCYGCNFYKSGKHKILSPCSKALFDVFLVVSYNLAKSLPSNCFCREMETNLLHKMKKISCSFFFTGQVFPNSFFHKNKNELTCYFLSYLKAFV